MYRNVIAEMARQGITNGAMARHIGVTPTTMSLKLHGKAPVTLEEALSIKQLLHIFTSVEDLWKKYEA